MGKEATGLKGNDIYDILKGEVLNLKLTPGQSISEPETAARFGMSRTPIREAFRKMENEKLLEVKPKVGTRVARIQMKKVFDILYLREAVEAYIYQSLVNHVEEYSVQKMSILLAKQKMFLEEEDDSQEGAGRFLALDNQFHRELFDIAGKSGVWEILMESCFDYERTRIFLNLSHNLHMKENYKEHELHLAYLVEGNIEKLLEHNKKHLYGGVSRIYQALKEHPEYFDE